MNITFHQLIVFLSGYIVYGMTLGLFYASGSLFPVIIETFGVSRAEAAIVQSIYAAFLNGGGIVFGLITGRFGKVKTSVASSIITSLSLVAAFWTTSLHYLIATSVLTACGIGTSFIACTVGIRGHFDVKTSVIVLALMSSSSGTTGVAWTYLLQHLSDTYGLRGMFLIIGGLELNCAGLSFLWRRANRDKTQSSINNYEKGENKDNGSNVAPEMSNNFPLETDLHLQQTKSIENMSKTGAKGIDNDGYCLEENSDDISMNGTLETVKGQKRIFSHRDEKKSTNNTFERSLTVKIKLKYLLSNKVFIVTALGQVICINALLQYVVFLLDMYSDRGYSNKQGTTGLTIMNIAAIIGRASPAAIANCPFYNTFLLPVSSTIIASIAMSLLTVADNIILYHVLTLSIGYGLGICASIVVVSVSELVETEYTAEAVGFVMTAVGFFSLIGGPFTGFLRDSTGSYTLSQILTSVFTGLGSAMFLMAAYLQRTQRKQLDGKKRDSIHYITKL